MQKKIQTAFICQNCGSQSPKWLGKCPQCGQWNTFVEEIIKKTTNHTSKVVNNKINKPQLISDIDYSNEKRIICADNELNRVLGGGIVPVSLILLGGDPGIGKSTLLLQVTAALAQKARCIYISGEEAVDQIRMRAARLDVAAEPVELATATNVANILATLDIDDRPDVVVIDSIQTMSLS